MLQIKLKKQKLIFKLKNIKKTRIMFKKFKKLRILKNKVRLKKQIFKSIPQIHLLFNIILKVFNKNISNLLQTVVLNNRIYEQNLLFFFYKYNKEDYFKNNLITYLYDYNKKPFWKLRKSRNLHWSLIYNKTIRKQRYINFNKCMLKYNNIFFNKYIPLIIYLNSFYISWNKLQKITQFFSKYNIILKKKAIFQLPIYLNYFINWNLSKKKKLFLKKKIGKWSFLNFKRFYQPWLQKKKLFPTVVKKLFPKLNILIKNIYYDRNVGSLILLKRNIINNIPFINDIFNNFLIKLNVFRYKPINDSYLQI